MIETGFCPIESSTVGQEAFLSTLPTYPTFPSARLASRSATGAPSVLCDLTSADKLLERSSSGRGRILSHRDRRIGANAYCAEMIFLSAKCLLCKHTAVRRHGIWQFSVASDARETGFTIGNLDAQERQEASSRRSPIQHSFTKHKQYSDN
jgi:hypothetical protein